MESDTSRLCERIDLETWERRALFQLFTTFTEPYHGVCLRLDCTEAFRYAKSHSYSIFLTLVHRSLLAVNQVDNFKTRIVDGEVWLYRQIHGGSAVGRRNGTIGFGHYPFQSNLQAFVVQAAGEIERVKQRDDLERRTAQDLVRYSVLPWFDFTSVSHARDLQRNDSAPYITFGKITQADNRCTMPVSIHAHHALADGSHVAQFVELFQHFLHHPETA
jgi:chloramphenicol O-acetyltransferase type A